MAHTGLELALMTRATTHNEKVNSKEVVVPAIYHQEQSTFFALMSARMRALGPMQICLQDTKEIPLVIITNQCGMHHSKPTQASGLL